MTLVHEGFCSLSGGLFVRKRHMSSSYSSDSSDDDTKRCRWSRDGVGDVSVRRQKRRSSPVSPSHGQSDPKRPRLSTGSEQSEGRQYSPGTDPVQSEKDNRGLRIGEIQSVEGTVGAETVHIQSEDSRSPETVPIQSEDTESPGNVHTESGDSHSPRTVHIQSEEDIASTKTIKIQSGGDTSRSKTSQIQSSDTHNPNTVQIQSRDNTHIPKIIQVQSVRDIQNPRTGFLQAEKRAENPRSSGAQSASHVTQSKQSCIPPTTQCETEQPPKGSRSSQGQTTGGSTGDKNHSPHVTKISHKIKVNNQLLAFQKPVFFFRWFEHVEKFLQQASHMTTIQKGSNRSQSAAHQTAAAQPAASQSAGVHTVSGQTVTMPQATPAPQMATFASPQPPTIAPKVSGIGQPTAGASQTFLVPVAGASANGTMTLIGPPGGTNLASSQYRFTTVQASPKPTGVTVREMLDNKQTGGVLPVTQVNITSNPNQSESGVQEKVIDLTEDEENSSAKSTLTPITLAPGQVIVQGPMTSKSNGNIPTGTYLVPVTSGQPIILQSVVQQQLQQPLLLSSTRPGVSQQQIAPATGQQLVNLVPAQAGVRPLLIQTPAATQPVSTTTQVVSKSVPAAHTTTAKPITSKQLKHPAPLPPQPTTSKIGAEFKSPPPKPKLTISRVPQGIVLSWNLSLTDSHAAVANYQLYAYQEGTSPPVSSLWKRVGDVKALPLPMACTLTQFHEGNKYYFAVRGVDEHGRVGPFSDPNSIHLDPASTS